MTDDNTNAQQRFEYVTGDLFTVVEQWLRAAVPPRVVLITIIAIDGRSPYPLGTQMALNEGGEYCGYLTSGCAEHAILYRAWEQLEAQAMAVERYGKGSPYMDIVLPCGSGIDVLIDPLLPVDLLRQMVRFKQQRQAFALTTDWATQSHQLSLKAPAHSGLLGQPEATGFVRTYTPDAKLIIAGQGPIVRSLAWHALHSGFHLDVYCDDEQMMCNLHHPALHTYRVEQLDTSAFSGADAHCAFVSLFHEHDREIGLLAQALPSACFYLGALGSKTSHAQRVEALASLGFSADHIARIHGPIGLPINATTPAHIAIAIVAEIIRALPSAEQ